MGRSRSHILFYCQCIREELLNTEWLSSSHMMVSGGFTVFRWGPAYFLAPHCGTTPPPRKKHLILHSLERVCVLACVQTATLSESKGKLSVLCCIQKWRKFIHTQESCNVEALSWWALEKEVDNQINSTVWYEQTFAGETIRHIHIYTHTPINTHV